MLINIKDMEKKFLKKWKSEKLFFENFLEENHGFFDNIFKNNFKTKNINNISYSKFLLKGWIDNYELFHIEFNTIRGDFCELKLRVFERIPTNTPSDRINMKEYYLNNLKLCYLSLETRFQILERFLMRYENDSRKKIICRNENERNS